MTIRNWDSFSSTKIETDETRIFVRWGGAGPAILLLHGFPETHLMWRDVAPLLSADFTVVCPDLRGYGQSGCPASAPDHAPHSKRAMARDMVAVMQHLGFERFSLVGHDRGGRVAYRLALDHPERVQRLAVLDIVPTEPAWERADARFALAFWPWSLLAQPSPLPERVLLAAAAAVVDDALGGWGTPPGVFPPEVRTAYVRALQEPSHAHAICEEYRAAASIDRKHDQEDKKRGRRITCPVLVMWSAPGPLGTWYDEENGPIALWREWSDKVQGHPIEAGHFFAEECPQQTATALSRFFGSSIASPEHTAG